MLCFYVEPALDLAYRTISVKPKNCLLIIFSIAVFSINISSLQAKPIWEKEWLELKTANFIIFSELKEKETRRLGNELEAFRSIVLSMTNMDEATIPRIPTYITVFKKRLKDLGLKSDVAGAFVPGLRSNHMIVFSSGKNFNRHIIQHEYTHFLTRNHSSAEYPTWFDEGFSEFLATVKLKKSAFTYGDVSENRMQWLSYYPWHQFDKLIKITDTNDLKRTRKGVFYAQSWALVHYLLLGRKGSQFSPELTQFLQFRKQGLDPVSAFERGFNLNTKDLRGELRKYLSRKIRYYEFPLDRIIVPKSASIETLNIDSVANRIGELCLAIGEYENSGKYFLAAREYNLYNARAHTGIADVHKFANEFDLAEGYFKSSIEIEPDNALHYLDFAEYYAYRADSSPYIAEKIELLEKSINMIQKSIELDDNNPEALIVYAQLLLLAGENHEVALEKALKAHRLLPSHPSTKLVLAEIFINMGFDRNALELLQSVLGWSHSSAVESATKLMRRIDPTYMQTKNEKALEEK